MAWLGVLLSEKKNNVGEILIWQFGNDLPILVYRQI